MRINSDERARRYEVNLKISPRCDKAINILSLTSTQSSEEKKDSPLMILNESIFERRVIELVSFRSSLDPVVTRVIQPLIIDCFPG